MTPDQVSGFFDAGESFVEGTIGAALVVLWLLALGLHLARPYMVGTTGKFTLRLGADLWWIIYVALRDIFLLQVFLGSFIFFYPDVVAGQDLPDHRRAGGRLRVRGAAHQAHHEGRRRPPLVPRPGPPHRASGRSSTSGPTSWASRRRSWPASTSSRSRRPS